MRPGILVVGCVFVKFMKWIIRHVSFLIFSFRKNTPFICQPCGQPFPDRAAIKNHQRTNCPIKSGNNKQNINTINNNITDPIPINSQNSIQNDNENHQSNQNDDDKNTTNNLNKPASLLQIDFKRELQNLDSLSECKANNHDHNGHNDHNDIDNHKTNNNNPQSQDQTTNSTNYLLHTLGNINQLQNRINNNNNNSDEPLQKIPRLSTDCKIKIKEEILQNHEIGIRNISNESQETTTGSSSNEGTNNNLNVSTSDDRRVLNLQALQILSGIDQNQLMKLAGCTNK